MTFVRSAGNWGLRISPIVATLVTGLLLIPSLASGQYSTGPDFKPLVDSDGEVVFNYSADMNDPADRCDSEHIPDLATRAFRDKDGRVQLIISHRSDGNLGGTRRMLNSVGDLGALTNDVCSTKVLTSSEVNDPASNNNYEWLAAPYTLDGQTVWSLVYDEYQPWRDQSPVTLPDECVTNPAAGASGCHYSSYTLGKSINQGDSYGALSPNPFVAGIPYKYEPRVPLAPGQSVGYADTSNIAKGPDGRYYAMFLPRPYPRSGTPVQKPGTCVMRTATLDVPGSWVAWGDGPDAGVENGWEVQFADPYPTEPPNKAEHVCAPVTHLFPDGQPQPGNPISMSESLTYNRYLGKYMVIGASTNNSLDPNETGHAPPPPEDPDDWDWDLYYSLSTDLVNWERKRLLINVPHKFEGCTKEPGSATLYSSAIDHQSTTRNFETTGKKFYVYVTRFNDQSCGGGIDRDLVRIPIELDIEPVGDKHATLEDGLTDPDTGFDSTSLNGFDLRSGEAYEGDNYAQATWISSGEQPHGVLDVNWSRGSDVWYSAGFRIVSSNFSDPSQGHAGASIMQWTGASGSGTGGVYLRSDGQWELRRGAVSISEPFTLPENHWFHLAVHQRLNQQSQAPPSPFNQVFVNGQLKGQSVADNMFTNEALVPRKVKFGLPVISGQPAGVYVDRAYVGRNQQPPVGAPLTPEIFSGQEGNTYNWLHWHASPGAVGYDLYKLGNTGAFVQVTPNPITTPSYLHWPLDNCSKHRYVVAAYDAQGRRSVFSEPLELMPRDPATPC